MRNLEMHHPSRPGYHGAPPGEETLARLARVAEAMIPAAPGWPVAGDLVRRFTAERTSPQERDALEALLGELPEAGDAEITTWLRTVEADRPEEFAQLRAWVYYGYYGSGTVIDILDATYGYHGAPQPLGYKIERPTRLPTESRGSFRGTEEVKRVIP